MSGADDSAVTVAALGEMVVIVRGEQTFSLPKRELGELTKALLELGGKSAHSNGTTEPAAGEGATTPVAGSGPVRRSKRGELWKAVDDYLASCDRAQGFDAIVRHVKSLGISENPVGSLRVLLGRRTARGHLTRTKTGRYKLSGSKPKARPPARPSVVEPPPPVTEAPAAGAAPTSTSPDLPTVPRSVWAVIHEELSRRRDGATIDELIELVVNGGAAPQTRARASVVGCLQSFPNRVSEKHGRWVLKSSNESSP